MPKPRRAPIEDLPAGPQLIEDFAQSLPMLLLRARESVMVRVRPRLRVHGVTEQQWRVLRTLANAGPLEAAQLARRVYLMRPSLTRIVRDLQARGLIARRVVGASVRGAPLSITDQGRALIAETALDVAAIQDDIERLFGPADLADLKASLAALEAKLAGGG